MVFGKSSKESISRGESERITRRIKYGRDSEQTDRMFLIGKRLGSFENGLLDLVKGSSLVNFLKAK